MVTGPPPVDARSRKVPSAAVVARVDGTPSIVSCTCASRIGNVAASQTVAGDRRARIDDEERARDDQLAIRRGTLPGSDGTTSTVYSAGTSRTDECPRLFENASTTASGAPLGANRR